MSKASQEDIAKINSAKQGLSHLREEGIYKNRDTIFKILDTFPNIKQSTLSDKEFQKEFFEGLKEDALENYKNSEKNDYHKHFVRFEDLIKYAKEYKFIQEFLWSDTELQDILEGQIRFNIASIKDSAKGHILSIDDLLNLQKLYSNIKTLTKSSQDKNICLVIDMLREWTSQGAGGIYYFQVLSLVKLVGATNKTIQEAIVQGWKQKGYDPIVTTLSDFPKKELEKEDIRDEIADQFIYLVSNQKHWSTFNEAQNFLKSYTFLDKYLEKYNILINNFSTYKESLSDKEKTNIKYIKSSLYQPFEHKAWSKYCEIVLERFPNIKNLFSEEQIHYLVTSGGIFNTINQRDEKENADHYNNYKRILEARQLSQNDAAIYIQTYKEKNKHSSISTYIENLERLLDILFPGQDSSITFGEEVKNLTHRIKDVASLDDNNKRERITKLIGLSEESVEKERIKFFIDDFKNTLTWSINPTQNSRGVNIHELIEKLKKSNCDISTLQKELQTTEIKQLTHQFVQMKMADWNWGFTDVFGTDDPIEHICKEDFFPLSSEEVQEDIIYITKKIASSGYYSGISHMKQSYVTAKSLIENPNEVLINAGIDGIVYLINQSSPYDLKKSAILLFIRELPVLIVHRTNERIQQAITDKGNEFLEQGKIDAYSEVIERYDLKKLTKDSSLEKEMK